MAQASISISIKKSYCKAVWYEGQKDADGLHITQSHAVPADWIDKTKKHVYWPPKGKNAKPFVDLCTPRPRGHEVEKKCWQVFKLVSCGRAFPTQDLAEADATTECDDFSGSQDDEGDSDTSGVWEKSEEHARRRRKRKPKRLQEFTAGEGLSEVQTSSKQKPIATIASELGDMSASQTALLQSRKRTAAERKMVPPLPNVPPDFLEEADVDVERTSGDDLADYVQPSQTRLQASSPLIDVRKKKPCKSSSRRPSEDGEYRDIDVVSPTPSDVSTMMSQSQRSSIADPDEDDYLQQISTKKMLTNMSAEIRV